jgi:hypothetical protein
VVAVAAERQRDGAAATAAVLVSAAPTAGAARLPPLARDAREPTADGAPTAEPRAGPGSRAPAALTQLAVREPAAERGAVPAAEGARAEPGPAAAAAAAAASRISR